MRLKDVLIALIVLVGAPLHTNADAISDLLDALEPPSSISQLPQQVAQEKKEAAPAKQQNFFVPLSFDFPQANVDQLNSVTPLAEPESDQIASLRALVAQLTQRLKDLTEKRDSAPSFNAICSITRSLVRGSEGEDVKALQTYLRDQGLVNSDGITGFFGEQTELAVKLWQKNNGPVDRGSPSTTGYGVVGTQTRALMQQACMSESGSSLVDPSSPWLSNIFTGEAPQQVRILLRIDGSTFKRGDQIPVVVTVLDPIPYSGADIGFIQQNSEGAVNFFGEATYLPVGFTGEISRTISASHMNVESKDSETGASMLQLRAIVEARFFDSGTNENITRDIGYTEWQQLEIQEDTTSGTARYFAGGVSPDDQPSVVKQHLQSPYNSAESDSLLDSFLSGAKSRADAVEICGMFAEMVKPDVSFGCSWEGEDISGPIRQKKQTIQPSRNTLSISLLGSLFLFEDGVIHGINLSISRDEALDNCSRNHTGSPTVSMKCIWNNEVIYDKGRLE